jgi:hypothetical protein
VANKEWAIRSQVPEKSGKGSTTTLSSLSQETVMVKGARMGS